MHRCLRTSHLISSVQTFTLRRQVAAEAALQVLVGERVGGYLRLQQSLHRHVILVRVCLVTSPVSVTVGLWITAKHSYREQENCRD